MPRYTEKQYRVQLLLVMVIYFAMMLLIWPHARSASILPWKIVLALAPVVPMLVALWLIAKRIMHGDELEQRLHLVALSVATGAVSALSLIGGFLCAAGALALQGDVLIWMFPALALSYSATRWWLGRRYGSTGCQ